MSDLNELKEKEKQAEEILSNLKKLKPEQLKAFSNMIIGVATMNDIMSMNANLDEIVNRANA